MSLPGDARAADAGYDCTSIVKRAFEKTLAITKVGMECELKMSKLAQENSDAHTSLLHWAAALSRRCVHVPHALVCPVKTSLIGVYRTPWPSERVQKCHLCQAAPVSKLAHKNSNAHSCFFLGCYAEQKVCACDHTCWRDAIVCH